MTDISKRKSFKREIGNYYLIPSLKTSKENFRLILGPYEIDKVFNNGAVRIKTIDEFQNPLIVNGHRLKIYHKPLSKEQFVKMFQENPTIRLVKNNPSFPLA